MLGHGWLGACYSAHSKLLYFDGHERDDVVKYRQEEWLPVMHGLMCRTDIWRSLEADDPQLEGLAEDGVELYHVIDVNGKPWVEYCMDDFDDVSTPGYFYRRRCGDTERRPLIVIEQDEVNNKTNQDQICSWKLPKKEQHRGTSAIKAKSEGGGFMTSCFRTWGGGWLRMTPAQKEALETTRGEKFKHLTLSEGFWHSYHFFDYGKNKDGW